MLLSFYVVLNSHQLRASSVFSDRGCCQYSLVPACFFHSLHLVNHLRHPRFISSSVDYSTMKRSKTDHVAAVESFQSPCGPGSPNISSYNDQFVWPWRGIILNVSKLLGQERDSEVENDIKEQLNRFTPKGVHVLWDYERSSGHAVVEFNGDWTGFVDAMLFENAFTLFASDMWNWKEPKHHQVGLYGWIAREADYNDDGILGHYLRENGVLKRISDMKSEDMKRKKRFVALAEEIDYKNWRLLDLESKYGCISQEKDELHRAIAEETGKIQYLIEENEKLKKELESQRMLSEKIVSDRKKVRQKLRLMERKLKTSQCRDGDNKGKEIRCFYGDIDGKEICCSLKQFEERENEIKNLEDLNQTLMVREHLSNNELQEARKEFINVLKDFRRGRGSIGVKRLGVVDEKPFKDVLQEKYSPGEANVRAAEMCSSWQELVNNASWHPFKMMTSDGKLQEIIDDNDEKLKGLREEWGNGIYMAVVTALLELNEHNSSGRYAIQELWNFSEKRKATLKEAIQCISKKLKNKRNSLN